MTHAVSRRRSWLWLQGLGCGAAATLATGPVVLVAVLLAPALAAYATEHTAGKPRFETMLLLGVATLFGPLRLLWETGHTLESCLALLGDPQNAGLSWLAGAAGWFLEEVGQITARQLSNIGARRRAAALERERAALVAEWGPLVQPHNLLCGSD